MFYLKKYFEMYEFGINLVICCRCNISEKRNVKESLYIWYIILLYFEKG